jgi:daunorubicin resistance ABC transporter membrane protein
VNPAIVSVLVRRDLRLFFRQPSRILGALAQPLLFWLVLGTGLAPSFAAPDGGVGYRQFFYPGVVVMMLLFTSISTTMSVIEDRHQGFLQGVLAAPGGRASLALGKILGGSAVALLHALLLLPLAPLAGFPIGSANFGIVCAALVFGAVGLTSVGFLFAWRIDSTAGYHVVMSVVLLPLWVLSGALFPLGPTHPVMAWAGRLNPMTYAVSALRDGLSGAPAAAGLANVGILALLTFAALFFASRTRG